MYCLCVDIKEQAGLQARPNQPQRGSLSASRTGTESDPRWGWLGLAWETRGRPPSLRGSDCDKQILCLLSLLEAPIQLALYGAIPFNKGTPYG